MAKSCACLLTVSHYRLGTWGPYGKCIPEFFIRRICQRRRRRRLCMHLESLEYLEYLRYLTTLPDLLTYHLHVCT